MEASAELEAALASLSAGDAQARQRGYAVLEEAGGVPPEGTAGALVGVLCSEQTEAREYSQVCALLAAHMLRDKHGTGAEYWRSTPWADRDAPLFVAAASRSPEELRAEDMRILAWAAVFCDIVLAKGLTDLGEATGISQEVVITRFAEHLLPPACQGNPGIDERRIVLGLEMLRGDDHDAPQGQLSDLQLAGVYSVVAFSVAQRPQLASLALHEGLFELGVAARRRAGPPDERTRWRTTAGILCGAINMAIVQVGVSISALELTQRMYSSGAVECACAEFQALQARGGSQAALDEANVNGIVHALMMLKDSDLAAPEAQPAVAMLEAIPSALEFMLDYSLRHLTIFGITSSALCAQITAVLFGKREAGEGFEFVQKHIAQIVTMQNSMLDGPCSGFWPQKSTCFLKPIAHLCVSDENVRMLVVEKDELLRCVRGLLDTITVREDMSKVVQAAVQMDAADSLLQLACFAPGRDMLADDQEIMRSLHALAATEGSMALTSEAQVSAEGALLAIEGRVREPEPELSGGGRGCDGGDLGSDGEKHLMLSYQWDVQATIKRVNESLIARGYVTWFDLTNMKGSTVDAMSDAIEGADVMLYGVSLKYKESANVRIAHSSSDTQLRLNALNELNGVAEEGDPSADPFLMRLHRLSQCRMEANYAHQQELDMIPLMMQKDYAPKGWLGMILGTRMWYRLWDAQQDDDAAFEHHLDAVVREIGDRGKPMLVRIGDRGLQKAVVKPAAEARVMAEGVPPPAPAPAPAPAPTRASAPRTATLVAQPLALGASVSPARGRSLTPSVASLAPRQLATEQQHASSGGAETENTLATGNPRATATAAGGGGGGGGGVSEFLELAGRMQAAVDAQKAELLAKVAVAEAKVEELREEVYEGRLRDARQRDALVAALLARLEGMHGAELIDAELLCEAEDVIADTADPPPHLPPLLRRGGGSGGSAVGDGGSDGGGSDPVGKLLALSGKMTQDRAFARQLKRKQWLSV